jgi:hypothetical protein
MAGRTGAGTQTACHGPRVPGLPRLLRLV